MDQFAIGTFPFGATKLLSMMTGEVNYDDTFHPEDKSEDSVIEPILTKCLFLVFIVVVAIVLQNLLIGLSISDIQVNFKKHVTVSENILMLNNTQLKFFQTIV